MSILILKEKTIKKTRKINFWRKTIIVKWLKKTEKQNQKQKKWEIISSLNLRNVFWREREKFKRRREEELEKAWGLERRER